MKEKLKFYALVLATLAFILAFPIIEWWKAGVQTRIYQEQGIHITRFEVFMGIHPTPRIKEPTK